MRVSAPGVLEQAPGVGSVGLQSPPPPRRPILGQRGPAPNHWGPAGGPQRPPPAYSAQQGGTQGAAVLGDGLQLGPRPHAGAGAQVGTVAAGKRCRGYCCRGMWDVRCWTHLSHCPRSRSDRRGSVQAGPAGSRSQALSRCSVWAVGVGRRCGPDPQHQPGETLSWEEKRSHGEAGGPTQHTGPSVSLQDGTDMHIARHAQFSPVRILACKSCTHDHGASVTPQQQE